MLTDDLLVAVQPALNGRHCGFVRVSALESIHRFRPDGAPVPLVHAYVLCNTVTNGDLPHDCELTPGPHRLLVCILRCHNTARAYAEVAARVEIECL